MKKVLLLILVILLLTVLTGAIDGVERDSKTVPQVTDAEENVISESRISFSKIN